MPETLPFPSARRGPRLPGDPRRYCRRVRSGRWQARPYDSIDHCRVNLGVFPDESSAARAVVEFWWGKREARPRYCRPVRSRGGERWMAVIVVPLRFRPAEGPGSCGRIRLGGYYQTAAEAAAAVRDYLTREFPPEVAEALLGGREPPKAGRRAA